MCDYLSVCVFGGSSPVARFRLIFILIRFVSAFAAIFALPLAFFFFFFGERTFEEVLGVCASPFGFFGFAFLAVVDSGVAFFSLVSAWTASPFFSSGAGEAFLSAVFDSFVLAG